jgi:hypothetical protein
MEAITTVFIAVICFWLALQVLAVVVGTVSEAWAAGQRA